ncbi:hypothetical protein ACFQH2_14035 [Natronoarchaeum sp. GCM10025703]|uniref:hypothetical protein n=1 Tax=Natronoarchaeum sp. GCM10025703 TaxID=3252685 RepID=UPI0036138E36
MVLSGSDPLEIIDVQGVKNQETVDSESRGAEAGASGRVVVWSGDGAPDPLKYPADHSGYSVQVKGDVTNDTQPIGNVTEDGTEYVLSTTTLAEGETIDSIDIVPPVNYERSHDYVSDATTVDTQATLRPAGETDTTHQRPGRVADDDGGAWLPGVPSAPDLSGSFAGIAVIGVVVVSVIWGVLSDAIPFLGN